MEYNGFYFWMFKRPMKKVLTERYGKAYAAEIMRKSKSVYRQLVEQADDVGDDNPMAYNELFALAFVAPYVASGKQIPPETVQEMMRRSLFADHLLRRRGRSAGLRGPVQPQNLSVGTRKPGVARVLPQTV